MLFFRRGHQGFTLLELIVVIVILAVLAALAIPTFSRVIERTKDETAGISLASIARNAQALRAVDSSSFTRVHVEGAVEETVGSLAVGSGEYAAGKFTVAAGSQSVVAGGATSPSLKYGEVAWALSSDSSTIGLTMRSTTGRCVLVKAAETSGTVWMISKSKMPNCPPAGALLIEGPNGGTVDVTPGEDTGGEVPVSYPPTPQDDISIPGNVAPDTTLATTGEYCVDNACAAPVLLQAEALQLKYLTPNSYDERYTGVVVDTVNQRLIASRSDGIYFVNWSTGEATKVSDIRGAKELIYFRPGFLFFVTGGDLVKMTVQPGGLTLVSDDLVGAGNATVASNFEMLAGDVVGGGAQLYLGRLTGDLPFSSAPYGLSTSYIGKADINGVLKPQPVAYYDPNAAALCGMSADANYLYLNMSDSYSGTAATSERSGIYRIPKNSSNLDLGSVKPWAYRQVGCDPNPGAGHISALGEKIFAADGMAGTLVAYDKNTAQPKLLLGGASDVEAEGVGRAATLPGRNFLGLTAYKNRAYGVSSTFSDGRIAVMSPAVAPRNNVDVATLNVTEATPAAPLRVFGPPVFTLAGDSDRGIMQVVTPSGGGSFNQAGDFTAFSSNPFRPGTAAALGDTLLIGSQQIFWNQAGDVGSLRFKPDTCFDFSVKPQNVTRAPDGTPWCFNTEGLTEYPTPSTPQLHRISGVSPEFAASVVRVALDGSNAYVVTFNPTGSYSVYVVALNTSNAALALVETVSFTPPASEGQFELSYLQVAASKDALFLPVPDGVVKVSKSGGHSYIAHNPGSSAVISVSHDGNYLYFGTDASGGPGTLYRIG